MEFTIVLIKPDFIRKLNKEFVIFLKQNNLSVLKKTVFKLNYSDLELFYGPEKATFPGMKEYFKNRSVVCMIVNGENAISKILLFKNDLRKKLGLTLPKSGLHSSDNKEEAQRELDALNIILLSK